MSVNDRTVVLWGGDYPELLIGPVNVHYVRDDKIVWHSIWLLALICNRFIVLFLGFAIGRAVG